MENLTFIKNYYRFLKILAFSLSLLIYLPHLAKAQSSPVLIDDKKSQTTYNNTIVITGKKIPESKRIERFVESITVGATFDKPIARIASPVCIAVVGLSKDFNEAVADRMLSVADTAGIRLAGENCSPNIVVMFCDEDSKNLRLFWKRRPQLFNSMSLHEIKRLLGETNPVHVIRSIATTSSDGKPMVEGTAYVPTASLISLPIKLDIISSVVIVRRSALIGFTSVQVGGYLAMRSFTNAQPPADSYGFSILELFEDKLQNYPQGMTDFDKSYLKLIYSGSGNVRGIIKVSEISRFISNGH